MTTSQNAPAVDRPGPRPAPARADRAARTTAAPDRLLLAGALALTAVSVAGGFVSVASGLADTLLDAMGPTGRLSIPLPMMVGQLVAAWVASGRRRRPAIVASALIALVEPVCIMSGFYDGGYSDPALTGWVKGNQLLLVAMLAVVGTLAARRVVRLWRGTTR